MCGIAAIQGKHTENELKEMAKILRHRGPDDKGFFTKDDISLGQIRLSIVDVEGGHQPIFNEDKTKCIVFNGEIYNFRFLKEQLKNKHKFSTKTDTEIILHLYEEEGPECIKKLDGMFTFVIYDNGKLFIGRDRLGIKPLYYGTKDKTIYFASELKALLHCSYITTFLPGYYYTSDKGCVEYFEIPKGISIGTSEDNILKTIESLLIKAVEKRLMSDVPVGVFLSGGIDSSIIAAIMRKRISGLHSFSVGMEGSKDLEYAREAAKFLDLKYHELIYNANDMLLALPEVIYYLESYDAPLVRSAIPCYFVSKLAHQYVKVVLTGEGADELFSGYKYLSNIKDEKALFDELFRITYNLHNTNLQRVDRLTMANSVEGRVPFLDIEFLTYIFSIPVNLKNSHENQEKRLLREAFKEYLPASIINRPKQKFSDGAGSIEVFKKIAEDQITDADFKKENNSKVRTKEELFYYRIFKKFYPDSILNCIGKTEVF
jgi:asparagine synthase (glutamine-hydrolysing)